jgi:hypothetical protein
MQRPVERQCLMAFGDARYRSHHERRTLSNGMPAWLTMPLGSLFGAVGLLIRHAVPLAQASSLVQVPARRGGKLLPGGRGIPFGPNRPLDGCGDDELVPFGENLAKLAGRLQLAVALKQGAEINASLDQKLDDLALLETVGTVQKVRKHRILNSLARDSQPRIESVLKSDTDSRQCPIKSFGSFSTGFCTGHHGMRGGC